MEKGLKIAVATSGRADWGLLSPIAHELQKHCSVDILATNMHLMPELGNTIDEISNDGFHPVRIPAFGTPAEICSQVMAGFGKRFSETRYDALLLLGDRYEMLAVAQCAVLAGIPVIHIAGGAVSEGAFDDSFRHAITKLSYLHFTETDEYRNRVIQLGEDPQRVVATGAIGLYKMKNCILPSKEELERSLGFTLDKDTILVTMHASTLEQLPPAEQMRNLVTALENSPYKVLYTYPNNDVDSSEMISLIEDHCRRRPGQAHAIPSLGHLRYLAALQYVGAVAGNSSSGIVEAPSAGIPVLNIGIRQNGRTAAKSVVNCGSTTQEITQGLERAMSPEMREIAAKKENPYFKENTLETMVGKILSTPFPSYPVKRFHDL